MWMKRGVSAHGVVQALDVLFDDELDLLGQKVVRGALGLEGAEVTRPALPGSMRPLARDLAMTPANATTLRTVNDTMRNVADQALASSAAAGMSPLTSASPPYDAVRRRMRPALCE